MQYYKDVQPWSMHSKPISVLENNDHLGLIVSGVREEEKNVDLKLKKARGSLFSLLGPAFSSRCLLSPSVQLHLYRTFTCPIARSGLAAMTLRTNHLNPLIMFQKKTIRGFLHLSDRAPVPSLFFLTGELPIEGKLHRDIFALFFNIWINPKTKIYSIVKYLMENSPVNSRTWSRHIRNLASLYDIEDPLELLMKDPPPKSQFKEYILTKITAYHEAQLRIAATHNSKMKFLNTSMTGLRGRHHPAISNITTTQGVSQLRPHLKMLCGDIYTYEQKSKYQGGSPHCRLCGEIGKNIEDLQHILTFCSAYSELRNKVLQEMANICELANNGVNFQEIQSDPLTLTQFILDCTSFNLTKRINYNDNMTSDIFTLSRHLCCHILKTRSRKLKSLELK